LGISSRHVGKFRECRLAEIEESALRKKKKTYVQQINRRYQTSPVVCNPHSRSIIDSSNACNQVSSPIVCTPLHGRV